MMLLEELEEKFRQNEPGIGTDVEVILHAFDKDTATLVKVQSSMHLATIFCEYSESKWLPLIAEIFPKGYLQKMEDRVKRWSHNKKERDKEMKKLGFYLPPMKEEYPLLRSHDHSVLI